MRSFRKKKNHPNKYSINNAHKMLKSEAFYLQIDGNFRNQNYKKEYSFFLLEASRETDTEAKTTNEGKGEIWSGFLEAAYINGFPQEPLHLACPGLNRHVKNLLTEFNHEPPQNTGINLKIKAIQSYGRYTREQKQKIIKSFVQMVKLLTFCSSLTFVPWPSISCNVSFKSFSS